MIAGLRSLLSILFGLDRSDPLRVPVVLYSRPNCHMCDEMQAELARARLTGHYELTVVDVDSERALKKRYGLRIPVLAIAGEDVFETRLTAREFRRELRIRGTCYRAEALRQK